MIIAYIFKSKLNYSFHSHTFPRLSRVIGLRLSQHLTSLLFVLQVLLKLRMCAMNVLLSGWFLDNPLVFSKICLVLSHCKTFIHGQPEPLISLLIKPFIPWANLFSSWEVWDLLNPMMIPSNKNIHLKYCIISSVNYN